MSFNIRTNCMPSCTNRSNSCCKAVPLSKSPATIRTDIVTVLLEKMLASIILVIASPLLLLVVLLIKSTSKGDIFYRGTRLGERKKMFNLYKFRTLPNDFQQRHGANLVSSKDDIPPFFRFLRDSRLDEFPQLVNIIKGEMQFVGPRPERPEVYAEKCKHIKNYDIRFSKRPGLIGYSQIFTPHGTSKRMRTMIDNRFIRKNEFECFVFSLYAAIKLVQNMTFKFFCLIKKYYVDLIIIKGQEKRTQERTKQKKSYVYLYSKDRVEKKFLGEIFDVNDDYFSVMTNRSIHERCVSIIIEKKIQSRKRDKKIVIRCDGEIYAERLNKNGNYNNLVVIKSANVSPLNSYKISRYFLNQGIVNM